MAVGTTYDHNLTRDDLLQLAYEDLGIVSIGDTLTGEQVDRGVKKLNNIIRQVDYEGRHLWADVTSAHLELVANQFIYSTADGLAHNITKLYSVYYRSADGIDYPMDIYTQDEYERIGDKYATGDPDGVYFEENLTLSSQRFHIWPTVNSQNTASLIVGTDANNYVCIRNVVGTTLVQPTTGANYLLYWQATDTAGSAWVTGTAYTAPKVIRYHHRRPLWDFDTSTDNPDMPSKYLRFLLHSLCRDLAPSYGIPMEERMYHEKMAMDAYEDVFASSQPTTTTAKNKSYYF